jgi:hypothetical protein
VLQRRQFCFTPRTCRRDQCNPVQGALVLSHPSIGVVVEAVSPGLIFVVREDGFGYWLESLPCLGRRLNEGEKCLRVRNMLREWKVDIVCFQETELEVMSRNVVRSLWGCHHVDWCCLDSRGASSGILIMWDKKVLSDKSIEPYSFTKGILRENVCSRFIKPTT